MKRFQPTLRTAHPAAPKTLLSFVSVPLLVLFATVARAVPAEADTHFAMRNISYTHGGSPSQTLDLYVPAYSKKTVPLIIWIHGGAWSLGDKGDAPIQEIEKRGYAAASINYRLISEAPFPAQLDDCRAAINFLKTTAQRSHIDPNKIGLWGESSGAHLATLVATTAASETADREKSSAKVQAVCDWAGPTDFLTLASQAKAPGQKFLAGNQGQVAQLLGGPPSKNPAKAALASPVTFVTKNCPPMMIVHGQLDTIVPPEQSVELASKLQAAGVPVQLVMLPGRPHALAAPDTWKMALDFFDSILRRNAQK